MHSYGALCSSYLGHQQKCWMKREKVKWMEHCNDCHESMHWLHAVMNWIHLRVQPYHDSTTLSNAYKNFAILTVNCKILFRKTPSLSTWHRIVVRAVSRTTRHSNFISEWNLAGTRNVIEDYSDEDISLNCTTDDAFSQKSHANTCLQNRAA